MKFLIGILFLFSFTCYAQEGSVIYEDESGKKISHISSIYPNGDGSYWLLSQAWFTKFDKGILTNYRPSSEIGENMLRVQGYMWKDGRCYFSLQKNNFYVDSITYYCGFFNNGEFEIKSADYKWSTRKNFNSEIIYILGNDSLKGGFREPFNPNNGSVQNGLNILFSYNEFGEEILVNSNFDTLNLYTSHLHEEQKYFLNIDSVRLKNPSFQFIPAAWFQADISSFSFDGNYLYKLLPTGKVAKIDQDLNVSEISFESTKYPLRIAEDKKGNYYVSSLDYPGVRYFDKRGKLLSEIPLKISNYFLTHFVNAGNEIFFRSTMDRELVVFTDGSIHKIFKGNYFADITTGSEKVIISKIKQGNDRAFFYHEGSESLSFRINGPPIHLDSENILWVNAFSKLEKITPSPILENLYEFKPKDENVNSVFNTSFKSKNSIINITAYKQKDISGTVSSRDDIDYSSIEIFSLTGGDNSSFSLEGNLRCTDLLNDSILVFNEFLPNISGTPRFSRKPLRIKFFNLKSRTFKEVDAWKYFDGKYYSDSDVFHLSENGQKVVHFEVSDGFRINEFYELANKKVVLELKSDDNIYSYFLSNEKGFKKIFEPKRRALLALQSQSNILFVNDSTFTIVSENGEVVKKEKVTMPKVVGKLISGYFEAVLDSFVLQVSRGDLKLFNTVDLTSRQVDLYFDNRKIDIGILNNPYQNGDYFIKDKSSNGFFIVPLKTLTQSDSIVLAEKLELKNIGYTFFHTKSGIYYLSRNENKRTAVNFYNFEFQPSIKTFRIDFNSVKFNPEGLEVSKVLEWSKVPSEYNYDENNLVFYVSSPSNYVPESIEYSYKLEGLKNSYWKTIKGDSISLSNLPPGKYKLLVKAENKYNLESNTLEYEFEILPPWYQTWIFRISVGLLVVLVFFGFYKIRTNQLRKRQKELEQTVEERTREVVIQKEEADKQREIAEEKNQEILDSINYAKRLQNAILPPPKLVEKWLKDSFILYLPKDIVAGDFYWMETLEVEGEELVMFSAADCTGHGVPGAMVSVVCSNAMNRAVKDFNLHDPGKILDKVVELVQSHFEKSEDVVKDGMDVALCVLNKKKKIVWFSGAHNPLYRVTSLGTSVDENLKTIEFGDRKLVEYKADKQPVGAFDNMKPFSTQEIKLNPNDVVYLSSDGFPDQFGGEKGKKYKYGKFKDFLLSMESENMDKQREMLNMEFESWKGEIEQVDDVCVIGVRV